MEISIAWDSRKNPNRRGAMTYEHVRLKRDITLRDIIVCDYEKKMKVSSLEYIFVWLIKIA